MGVCGSNTKKDHKIGSRLPNAPPQQPNTAKQDPINTNQGQQILCEPPQSAGPLNLRIRDLKGRTEELTISGDCQVQEFIIQAKGKFRLDHWAKVKLIAGGKNMDSAMRVMDFGLKNRDIVTLIALGESKITLKIGNPKYETCTFIVNREDSVHSLRSAMEGKWAVNLGGMSLYAAHGGTQMDGGRTLGDYSLQDGQILELI
jgi:hypothetical protein